MRGVWIMRRMLWISMPLRVSRVLSVKERDGILMWESSSSSDGEGGVVLDRLAAVCLVPEWRGKGGAVVYRRYQSWRSLDVVGTCTW